MKKLEQMAELAAVKARYEQEMGESEASRKRLIMENASLRTQRSDLQKENYHLHLSLGAQERLNDIASARVDKTEASLSIAKTALEEIAACVCSCRDEEIARKALADIQAQGEMTNSSTRDRSGGI